MRHRVFTTYGSARRVALLLGTLAALTACSREIGAESETGATGLVGALHAVALPEPAAPPPEPSRGPSVAVSDRVGGGAGAAYEWTSVLHSERDAEVATRIPGMMASVAVELGDRVRAGQLLATLRDEEEQVALEAARAAVELARLEQGDLSGAEALARRALDVQRRSLAPGHFWMVPVLTLLGRIVVESGRAAEAEPLLREAVAIGERPLPPTHYELARARSELGACLAALGRMEEAGPLLVAGYAALKDKLGEEHPLTRRASVGVETASAAGEHPR